MTRTADTTTEAYSTRQPEIQAVSFALKGVKDKNSDYIVVPKFGQVNLNSRIPGAANFYWYEATHGGTRIPPNEEVVNGICKIAVMAEEARNLIKVPMRITSWYRPADINASVGGAANSCHIYGEAIDFYADPYLGVNIFHILNGSWRGGLGHYGHFPHIVHIDCGRYARWGW